jgi:glycosyltransferase involved in cell wall biosynthesis
MDTVLAWPIYAGRSQYRGWDDAPVMVSIAICTYNNARKLELVLESLRGLICPPPLEYEILVVDNNSSDETIGVVERCQAAWGPRLRYIFEGAQGLSHARNRALKEAAADIISYLDDDVKVDPHWLSAVATAFEEYPAAVVGGKSYLIYPTERPAWLPEEYEFLLSKLDYGDQVIVGVDKDLFGLNFSVRKEWALRAGGFDPSLGRRGHSLGSGEESDLLKRIRARGGIAVYQPNAVVGHLVSPERVKIRWFLKRLFAAGKDGVAIARKDGAALPSVSEAILHALRCCGSVAKSMVLGDFSGQTLLRKGLVATYALGGGWARLRLALRSGLAGLS